MVELTEEDEEQAREYQRDRLRVDQTVIGIGNPRGNCLQAALATITGCNLDDVIDVTHPDIDPDMWHIALSEWGDDRGLQIASQRQIPEQEYSIAIGPTVRDNCLHAVIYRDGHLFHDPHPSRSGITRVRYYLAVREHLKGHPDDSR